MIAIEHETVSRVPAGPRAKKPRPSPLHFDLPHCSVLTSVVDKKIPALFVVAALSSEIVSHHEAPPPPHVEPEIRSFLPSLPGSVSASGNAATEESLGRFRWNTYYSKMRRTSLKKGEVRSLAMMEVYFETAQAIMERYPHLKTWERQFQYSCLKHQMDLYRMRGCGDLFAVLPMLAHILRIENLGS